MGRKAVIPLLSMVVLMGSLEPGVQGASADDLASARAAANKAAADESAAETSLGQLSQQIATLEAQKADAQSRVSALTHSVRDIAIQRFINADATQIATLDPDINAQARADALARFALRGNQDLIDEYSAAADDLAVAGRQLASRKVAEQSGLTLLTKRQAAVAAQLVHVQQLEAQRNDAASRVARAAAITHSAPAGPIATGAWVCPVQGPHAFSDDFGAPRAGGRRHQGNDIFSPRGTPTVAPVGGSVVWKANGLGGLAWQLSGDDGNFYYGAHLSAYANQGQSHVQAGTVIGYVGNTGDASGGPTHLHFEIHPNHGPAVDPYPTLRRYC